MYVFGAAMMFNSHLTMSNIHFAWSRFGVFKPAHGVNTHADMSVLTKRFILQGEEYISSYGINWYRDRNVQLPLASIAEEKLMISPETEYVYRMSLLQVLP